MEVQTQPATNTAHERQPILMLRHISKRFGAVQALKDVSFEVYPGEVVALVGDNGAGKSTLAKIISGVYQPDSGEYWFNGQQVTVSSPADAARLGIETVYQDLALCNNLDVVANLFLGREATAQLDHVTPPGIQPLNEIQMERQAIEVLQNLSVVLPSVRRPVATLSGGQRQSIAIARAVMWNSKVVILDEPTAALGVAQTRNVLNLIKRLRERGLGVVLISHNLPDVFEVADRIVVMRLGRRVATYDARKATPDQVVGAITGATLEVPDTAEPAEIDGHQDISLETTVAAPVSWRGGLVGVIRSALASGVGTLPVLIGLVIIALIFQALNHNFLTPLNLTNLLAQIAALGTIAVGVVLILLLGEIDLSVGAVSGLTAGVMAVLSTRHHLAGPLAVLAGLAAGAVIGLIQGTWTTKVGVPSFIVTLAGLLGWQGALLQVLGPTGTINLNDRFIVGLANTLLPVWLGWVLGALFVVFSIGSMIRSRQSRMKAGLPVASTTGMLMRAVAITVATLGAVAIMSVNRSATQVRIAGVPLGVLIFLLVVVGFDLLTRRTRFGRYIYAVGGDAEAARRAGINVTRVRIIVFMLSSLLAAAGGILAASRLLAVNQSSGSGDLLLDAIAAAVIGGTSLFGGRGSAWSALLGALVIGSIANGMDLLALPSAIKFMVTGAVLLLAVSIDVITRRTQEAAGRA